MNIKNLWLACLSGAAMSLLVSNLPIIGLVNLLLCAGFWGSSIFAVWVYRRLDGTSPTIKQAINIGLLSGLLAGVLGFLLSFVGLAGLQGFMNTAQALLPAEATQDMGNFPGWVAYIFNAVGVVLEVIFGAFGGWLGGIIFASNRKNRQAELVAK